MDISEIVKIIAKMTGMNKREQEQLEELIEQFDDIDEINSISDLEDLDFSQIDFDNFDIDFETFDFDNFDPGLGPRPGKRSVDDYRHERDDEGQDQIDIEIPEDHDEDESTPYQGNTWVEVEDSKYEAFVEIPDDMDGGELDISLRDSSVRVSDPIDETIDTEKLPTRVTSIDASVTEGGRLMIRVW